MNTIFLILKFFQRKFYRKRVLSSYASLTCHDDKFDDAYFFLNEIKKENLGIDDKIEIEYLFDHDVCLYCLSVNTRYGIKFFVNLLKLNKYVIVAYLSKFNGIQSGHGVMFENITDATNALNWCESIVIMNKLRGD